MGLMFRGELPEGHGMFIEPCNSIHMFFMRFPIDAVFVDERSEVMAIYHAIRPWRISSIHWSARGVFELPAGTARQTQTSVGDTIRIEEDSDVEATS